MKTDDRIRNGKKHINESNDEQKLISSAIVINFFLNKQLNDKFESQLNKTVIYM